MSAASLQPVAENGFEAHYARLIELLAEPRCVITIDVDWASDACILDTVNRLNAYGIVPTLFVTHASPAAKALAAAGQAELGIHPNFLAGSSHGSDVSEVLDAMAEICPEPIAVRCHSHAENSHIMISLRDRGLRFDSNSCLFLQPYIFPLRHWTGIWRFPVFWEDDIHWRLHRTWAFAPFEHSFFTPGLKIIGVHPLVQALNVPSQAYYDSFKGRAAALTADELTEHRHQGPGAGTFLIDMIESILGAGKRFDRLSDLTILSGPAGPDEERR